MLFVAFLVFALLDPILKSRLSEARSLEVYYLDTSPSMSSTNTKGYELLAEAYEYLKLGNSHQGTLITNQNVYTNISKFDANLGSDGRASDFEQINDQLSVKYASSQWVSDFQKGNKNLENVLNDSSHRYDLVLLPQSISSNLFVDSVFLSKPLGYGTGNSLEIVISNLGGEFFEDQILTVEKGNRQLATIPFSVKPNSQEQLVLTLSDNEQISGHYIISVDDASVDFDNKFYFSIDRPEKIKVTLVSEKVTNKFLLSALGNEEIFTVKSKSLDDVSNEDISKSNFLILDHLQLIPDWIISEVRNFSGVVLVIPSELDVDQNAYNSLLQSILGLPQDPVKTLLSSKSLKNPLFKGLFNQHDNLSLPFVSISMQPMSNRFVPLLTDVNGEVYVSRNDNLFFFGSSLDKQKTNIIDHAFFVPLIYSIAQESVHNSKLYYRIGQKQIVLSNRDESLGLFSLLSVDAQYILNHMDAGDRIRLDIPIDLAAPGFYHLLEGTDTLASIAMNYPKSESGIDFYQEDELKAIFSNLNHVNVKTLREATLEKETDIIRNSKTPLWKYALILAFFFLLAETLVLRFVK